MLSQEIESATKLKPEYSDYAIVAKVLTRARFQETNPGDITAHDFTAVEYNIIRFRIKDGAFPLSIWEFDEIWADIRAEEAHPKYEIIGSYNRGKVRIDVVSFFDGREMQTRCMWVDHQTLDEPVFVMQTEKGGVIKSNWRTTANNKWFKAYRTLWYEHNQKRVREIEADDRQETDQEEIDCDRYGCEMDY